MRSLSLNSIIVCHQYDHRTLEMTLDVPRLRTSGSYSLTGKVLNIEGLDSQGPYRSVTLTDILSVLGQVVRSFLGMSTRTSQPQGKVRGLIDLCER